MGLAETPIPFLVAHNKPYIRVTRSALGVGVATLAVEMAHYVIDPRLPLWTAHVTTALMAACFIAGFSFTGLKREKRLWAKLQQDTSEHQQGTVGCEARLRRSEDRVRLGMQAARMGFWDRDLITEEQVWSEGAKKLLGLPEDAPCNFKVLMDAIHPDDRKTMKDAIDRAVLDRKDVLVEYRTLWPDGSVHWLFAKGHASYDTSGKPLRISGIVMDIDERKAAEQRLRLQAAALESAANAIVITDAKGIILWTNAAFSRLTGYNAEETTGKNLRLLKSGEHDHGFYAKLWQTILAGQVWRGEVVNRHKDGTLFTEEQTITPVRSETGDITNFVAVKQDITDRKHAEKRIQSLAYFDAVTGLPNRTLLEDRLSKALASARRRKERLALLFLDLDHFKFINDSLGHSVGDLVLKEVATRLTKWVREQDTVARLGGDEFVLVLNGIKDVGDVAVAAKRVLDTLAVPVTIQQRSFSINCSIGISIFPDHGGDSVALTKNADAAMYSAKEKGRNDFQFFTPEMNTQIVERLTLESSLRSAIEKRELFLMYQPQMDLSTGQIIGAEALLRWQHPELGLVPPDKFIRIAENSGLILPIGEWVLRMACAQARQWQDGCSPAVPVAVNVSAVQFRHEGFPEVVKRVLDETGLAPQLLELELTESLIMSNADMILSVFRRLQEMGVRLSIDDFGTGYSSLSYLKHFPVYKLKVDRSFVRDIAHDPDDATITSTIITMAKSLKLKVIAEGVENEEQISFLTRHKCDEIQGYYFSKPLRPMDFHQLLQNTRQ